jgi:hypothetical protein
MDSLTIEKGSVLSSKELLINYIKKSIKNDKRIKAIIDTIDKKKKVAVWGTGHHTSRLLGMTNLKNKNIIKFYDSDIRKNGIKYYNKRIQPFEPIDLKNGEVDTILISTFVAQKAMEQVLIENGVTDYLKVY